MDLLLLLAQVVLAVLLVVMPLFTAFDKWQQWTPRRRLIAVAFAVGIAVVAFGQYQRIVKLSLGNVGLFHGPWYARRVAVSVWEYAGAVIAGAVLLAMAIDAGRKKAWPRVAACAGVFALMLTLALLLKLRSWGAD